MNKYEASNHDKQRLKLSSNTSNTHLLVLIQRIDDQFHHPVHFRLEYMLFCFFANFLNL